MSTERVPEINPSARTGEAWTDEMARGVAPLPSWNGVRQFGQSLEAMDRSFELSKRALGSSTSERARRARALDRALCRVLADLRRRKAELGHLPRSGLLSEAHLVLEAGLTMALRGVLFMQTGLQHHDDRSITFGAEQYREGMIHLRQGAHAMVQLTD